jgi:hypothetical protein
MRGVPAADGPNEGKVLMANRDVRRTVKAALRSAKAALPRFLLALAGGGALVAGAATAWRSGNATPLLVVGGVLVVEAYLGERWDRILLRHGDYEAEIYARAGFERLAEKVAELPGAGDPLDDDRAGADAPEALREQIGELREEVSWWARKLADLRVDRPHTVLRDQWPIVTFEAPRVDGGLIVTALDVHSAASTAVVVVELTGRGIPMQRARFAGTGRHEAVFEKPPAGVCRVTAYSFDDATGRRREIASHDIRVP